VPTQKTASKEAVFLHFVKVFGYENTNSKRFQNAALQVVLVRFVTAV